MTSRKPCNAPTNVLFRGQMFLSRSLRVVLAGGNVCSIIASRLIYTSHVRFREHRFFFFQSCSPLRAVQPRFVFIDGFFVRFFL